MVSPLDVHSSAMELQSVQFEPAWLRRSPLVPGDIIEKCSQAPEGESFAGLGPTSPVSYIGTWSVATRVTRRVEAAPRSIGVELRGMWFDLRGASACCASYLPRIFEARVKGSRGAATRIKCLVGVRRSRYNCWKNHPEWATHHDQTMALPTKRCTPTAVANSLTVAWTDTTKPPRRGLPMDSASTRSSRRCRACYNG